MAPAPKWVDRIVLGLGGPTGFASGEEMAHFTEFPSIDPGDLPSLDLRVAGISVLDGPWPRRRWMAALDDLQPGPAPNPIPPQRPFHLFTTGVEIESSLLLATPGGYSLHLPGAEFFLSWELIQRDLEPILHHLDREGWYESSDGSNWEHQESRLRIVEGGGGLPARFTMRVIAALEGRRLTLSFVPTLAGPGPLYRALGGAPHGRGLPPLNTVLAAALARRRQEETSILVSQLLVHQGAALQDLNMIPTPNPRFPTTSLPETLAMLEQRWIGDEHRVTEEWEDMEVRVRVGSLAGRHLPVLPDIENRFTIGRSEVILEVVDTPW